MTINGFSQYSSKNLSGVKHTNDVKTLAGKKVAIDTYLLVNQAKATALKHVVSVKTVTGPIEDLRKKASQETKRVFYERILDMCNFGWQLIFCFDSLHDTVGKQLKSANVGVKREADRASLADKIAEARRMLEECADDPIQMRTAIDEVIKFEKRNVSDGIFSLLQHFRNTITALGFPSFTPEDLFGDETMVYTPDGEAVASILVSQGLADIAYTTDADVLSYGCPVTITEIVGNNFTFRRLDMVLDKMKLDYNTFVVSCILGGLDFNTNVRGIAFTKALGIVKSARVEFIDLLAVQLQQLLAYCYDNQLFAANSSVNNNVVNNNNKEEDQNNTLVDTEWLIKQTSLSHEELIAIEDRYQINFETDTVLQLLDQLDQQLPQYVCDQKLWNLLYNQDINWFTVLALYRCVDYAVVTKAVDFDYDMFRAQARMVLISESLDGYTDKFCKSLKFDKAHLASAVSTLSAATAAVSITAAGQELDF